MEWLVIDAVYLRTTRCYVLVIHTESLKMMAAVTSETPVQKGDILYPVRDAMYRINRNEDQCLKVTSASAFSIKQWRFLKKLFRCQPASLIWADPKSTRQSKVMNVFQPK